MALQDELLKAMQQTSAVKPRPVIIPGWPPVYVRSMTVAEAEEQPTDKGKDKRAICRGVARLLCNEKGERILNPDNEEHIAQIAAQPWPLVQSILEEVDKLNGLSKESVENLGKNSPSAKPS